MPKKRLIQIELSDALHADATRLAAQKSRTLPELIKRMLKKRVEKFLLKQAEAAAADVAPKAPARATKARKPTAAAAIPKAPRRAKSSDDGEDR
jgi:hypothetical protein